MRWISIGALLLVAGCGRADDDANTSYSSAKNPLDAFVISERSTTIFAGSRTMGGATIFFRAEHPSAHFVRADVDVNGTHLWITADGLAGTGGVISFGLVGGQWKEGDHALLRALAEDFQTVIPWPETAGGEDSALPHEGLVRHFVSFMASAEHALPSDRFDIDIGSLPGWEEGTSDTYHPDPAPELDELGVVPGGVTAQSHCTGCNCRHDEDITLWSASVPSIQFVPSCCGGSTSRSWFHDTTASAPQPACFGTTLAGRCGAFGTTPCAGRCGLSCLAPGVYMQDCYDHDLCVRRQRGSVMWWNPSCGDEFGEAASDFAFLWASTFYGVMIYGPGFIPTAFLGCF